MTLGLFLWLRDVESHRTTEGLPPLRKPPPAKVGTSRFPNPPRSNPRREKEKIPTNVEIFSLAPGRGFEPRFTASKAAVLPLDDPGPIIDVVEHTIKP